MPRRTALYDPVHHIESARLYGNINAYAYWYVDLLVGTPPQRASVIVDTGSHVTAFPCANCAHCGKHIDPNFDIAKSTTAQWVPCGKKSCHSGCRSNHCPYSNGYAEGSSISGFLFEDKVRLGDAIQHNPSITTRMGCHQNENKLFYTQKANGIMGIKGGGFLQNLFNDRLHVESKVFALCLAEWGGRLVVGGYNQSYHTGDIVWIPFDPGSFNVELSSVTVSGTGGLFSPGRSIKNFRRTNIDSGTTYTYMGAEPYNDLRADIEEYCKKHSDCGAQLSGECWTIPDGPSGLSRFPAVEMYFGSAKTWWMPRAYLYRKNRLPNTWCYSFHSDGKGANTVLGASWLQHQEVIFDLRLNKLGIARANCPEYRERPLHGIVIEFQDELNETLGTLPSVHTTSLEYWKPSTTPADILTRAGITNFKVLMIVAFCSVVVMAVTICCVRRYFCRKNEYAHKQLEQMDESGMPPQIVGDAAVFGVVEVEIDDSDDGFQMVQNFDSDQGAMDTFRSPQHAHSSERADNFPSTTKSRQGANLGVGPLE